ncbi:hypothetical protein [Streptomyces roseolilacinus]|uniref:Uncharacterized protein n=1 Tax=Streptomyces roseolilacinus TaxID=66904 RepID=A0A918B1I3_9ACTN|nr:hypothetical protein [Streptomyces roseolilacinus]GGQ12281.1 hypothetical protein GCM10010249_33660 [Streptomyces roseolilacinus]
MTNPPPSKSLTRTPADPHPAKPAPARGGSGAPKVAAEGVLFNSGPRPSTGPRVVGMLHITAPTWRGGDPSAVSFCACGRYETARGEHAVVALAAAHTAHRAACLLQAEGRVAA